MTLSFLQKIPRDRVLMIAIGIALVVAAISARTIAFTMPLLALGYLVAVYRAGDRVRLLDRGMIVWLAALAGLAVISCFWSVNPEAALHHVTRFPFIMLGGGLLLTSALTIPVETLRRSGWVPAVALLIGAAILKFHQITDQAMYYWVYDVPPGGLVLPYVLNKSTAIITFALIPALVMLARCALSRAAKFQIGAALILIFGSFVVLCDNQSSQLGVIVMGAMFFLFPARSIWAWRGLGAVLVLGIIGAPLIALILFHPFAALGTEYEAMRAASVAQRLEIWHFIALKIMESPVLGYGFEATRLIPSFTTDQIYFGDDKVLHPHNAVLQLWIEFGVLGAIMGCVFVVLTLRSIYAVPNHIVRRAALAMFAGMFIVSLIGWGIWQGWLLMAMFAAAALMVMAVRVADAP